MVDRGWSWVIAGACCWITFVIQGLVRSGGVLYVALIDAFRVGRGAASWPFTLRIAVWNLSGPLAGALSYRCSIRAISLSGVLVVTLGNVLCWFAPDIDVVTLFLGGMQGLGIGMTVTLVPVIINQYFSRYKSTGAGIACAGATAGSFALPPLVEFAVEEYGLRGAFLLMGGVTLQGALGAALLRPAPPSAQERQRMLVLEERREPWAPLHAAVRILRRPMFLVLAANYAVFFLSYMTYLTVVVDVALDRGAPRRDAVFLVSAFSAADLIGRLGSGWVTDSGLVRRRTLVMLDMLASGCLLARAGAGGGYPALLGVSGALGLVVGVNLILFYALLEEYVGLAQMPMAVGIMNFAIGIVSLVTPFLTDVFRDRMGSYDPLFHLLGALSVLAGLMWLLERFAAPPLEQTG